jgi:hypothetical protein
LCYLAEELVALLDKKQRRTLESALWPDGGVLREEKGEKACCMPTLFAVQ